MKRYAIAGAVLALLSLQAHAEAFGPERDRLSMCLLRAHVVERYPPGQWTSAQTKICWPEIRALHVACQRYGAGYAFCTRFVADEMNAALGL